MQTGGSLPRRLVSASCLGVGLPETEGEAEDGRARARRRESEDEASDPEKRSLEMALEGEHKTFAIICYDPMPPE